MTTANEEGKKRRKKNSRFPKKFSNVRETYKKRRLLSDSDLTGEGASTSDVHDRDQSQMEEGDIEEEGLDGVTSEGEKANAGTDESNEVHKILFLKFS